MIIMIKTDEHIKDLYSLLVTEGLNEFKLRDAFELYCKKVREVSIYNFRKIMFEMKKRKLCRRKKTKYFLKGMSQYIPHNRYKPSGRPSKQNITHKLADVFNKHSEDNDMLVTLETEEFKFLKLLKKQLKPIICEINPKRFLTMFSSHPEYHIFAGDVDRKIIDGFLPPKPAHYYLDYCDTLDKHLKVFEHILDNKLIDEGKLFAVTFALNRHKESAYNQMAEAIKTIQKMFKKRGFFAEIMFAKTYKDGPVMNTLCFKAIRPVRYKWLSDDNV